LRRLAPTDAEARDDGAQRELESVVASSAAMNASIAVMNDSILFVRQPADRGEREVDESRRATPQGPRRAARVAKMPRAPSRRARAGARRLMGARLHRRLPRAARARRARARPGSRAASRNGSGIESMTTARVRDRRGGRRGWPRELFGPQRRGVARGAARRSAVHRAGYRRRALVGGHDGKFSVERRPIARMRSSSGGCVAKRLKAEPCIAFAKTNGSSLPRARCAPPSLRIAADFFSARRCRRIARELHGGGIREKLALTRDGGLDDRPKKTPT